MAATQELQWLLSFSIFQYTKNGSSFYNYVLPIISDQNSSNSLIILHFYSYVFFILEYKVDRGKEGLRRLEQEIEKFT